MNSNTINQLCISHTRYFSMVRFMSDIFLNQYRNLVYLYYGILCYCLDTLDSNMHTIGIMGTYVNVNILLMWSLITINWVSMAGGRVKNL